MNKKVEAEVVEPSEISKTELIVAEAAENAVALFTDGKQYSQFYERIEAEVSKFEPDLSTDTGRRKVASLAFRVTKAKTTLDKAGLALTEGWRGQIKAVNEARFKMVRELDELAEKVRKPLTDWEAAEESRRVLAEGLLREIRESAIVEENETAADVEARGRLVYEKDLEPELFGDRLEEAQAAKDAAVASLVKARDRLRKEEEDRAELERLRKENEERLAREQAEREEREAAEREAAETARKEREETERKEAEERRIAEAEERAREAARAEEQRKAEEALAEERRRTEEAERAAREAREREEARKAEEARAAEEQRQREADQAHRRKLMGEAKEDFMEHCKLDEKTARSVVLAIVGTNVRHIGIKF